MLNAFKTSKEQRQVISKEVSAQNGSFVPVRSEMLRPPKKVRSREFFDLMAAHRPAYVSGGHKGRTLKQRGNHRRQQWQRRFHG